MIINRLIIPEGNDLDFRIVHHENENLYKLAKGEFYYIKVSDPVEPFTVKEMVLCDNDHFLMSTSLTEGEYVFEIGIKGPNGASRIILPAIDERHRPLNQLLVLRRLEG